VSAFTTNQASDAKAPYGMVGVLADFSIENVTLRRKLYFYIYYDGTGLVIIA